MRLLLGGGVIVKAVPVEEDRPRDGTSWSRGVDGSGSGRGRDHLCVVGNNVVVSYLSSTGAEPEMHYLRDWWNCSCSALLS